MKARIKATGEIVEVKSKVITSFTGEHRLKYIDQDTGVSYFEEELFFPKNLVDDPNYWTRLEHAYAGMAMQGMLSDEYAHKLYLDNKNYPIGLLNDSITIAHALVEKLKEKEEKK